jgi:CubicO group peptidase (beta-lactamase class C family)
VTKNVDQQENTWEKARLNNLKIVCIILLLITAVNFKPSYSAEKSTLIDSIINEYHNQGLFNGSLLVAEEDMVIYRNGIGYANIEWNIPNTPHTKFRIASLTKQFTSMLVLQSVEQGLIALDAHVSAYLPEYPEKQGGQIKIHQLLSHTSGMPHYEAIPDFFPGNSRQPYKPTEFIRLFWNLDLMSKPGTEYSYSSFGYYLLGVILEKVHGKPYEDLLKEKILDPVGMNETVMDNHGRIEMYRAAGYDVTENGLKNASFRDMSTAFSTGALLSTVEDLYLWDRELYDDNLLPARYKNKLFKPNLENYGYGWCVEKVPCDNNRDSTTVVWHWGETNGFTSRIERFIDDRKLIVLLRNTSNPPKGNLEIIAKDIRDVLYGQP